MLIPNTASSDWPRGAMRGLDEVMSETTASFDACATGTPRKTELPTNHNEVVAESVIESDLAAIFFFFYKFFKFFFFFVLRGAEKKFFGRDPRELIFLRQFSIYFIFTSV